MSKDGGHLTVQYNLRWSEDMRDKIAAVAKENTRSMNQEIIARLEQSFEKEDAAEFDKKFVLQVVKNQQEQIDQLQNMVKQLVVRPREIDE